MKLSTLTALCLALAVATPALADKKLDDAVAKAMKQADEGKNEEALKTMQKAVSQQPTAEAHLALARLQSRLGAMSDAAASVDKAASAAASPADRADALATRAGYELMLGSGANALTRAQEAVKVAETAATLAALARAQVRTGDSSALATAERAVAAGANSAAAHAARGEALLAAGRAADAVAAYRQSVTLDARLRGARAGLANALVAAGQAAAAVAEAKTATEQFPNSPEAHAALGLATLAADPKAWGDAIGHAQQGVFLAGEQKACAPEVRVAVGKIFDAQDRVQESTAAYQGALACDPGFVAARAAMVQGQVRQGNVDAALPELKKLADEAPGNGDVQLQYGRALMRKEQFPAAEAPLSKATQLLPNNGEAWALYGLTLVNVGKAKDAVPAYKKAVELTPANVDYATTYGLLLGISGQHEAGVAELRKVVTRPDYKSPDAYVNLGWLYRSMQPKKLDESIAAYRRAAELDPKNAQAFLGMGMAYAQKKEWDNAIQSFTTTQQLESAMAGDALARIGWAQLGKRDAVQARAFYEKAKAAGRADPRLLDSIVKLEKGEAAPVEAAPDDDAPPVRVVTKPTVASLGASCMNGSGDACSQMGQFGAAAVTYLVNAVVRGGNMGAQIAAANELASMGAPAKSAVQYLKPYLEKITPGGMGPDAEKELQRTASLRRAIAQAIERLR